MINLSCNFSYGLCFFLNQQPQTSASKRVQQHNRYAETVFASMLCDQMTSFVLLIKKLQQVSIIVLPYRVFQKTTESVGRWDQQHGTDSLGAWHSLNRTGNVWNPFD